MTSLFYAYISLTQAVVLLIWLGYMNLFLGRSRSSVYDELSTSDDSYPLMTFDIPVDQPTDTQQQSHVRFDKNYRLYRRKFVWIRQIFLLITVGLNMFEAFHCEDEKTWTNVAALGLHTVGISILIYLDDIYLLYINHSINNTYYLFIYVYLSFTAVIQCLFLHSVSSIITFLMYCLCLCTFLSIFLPSYSLQHNHPPQEYTSSLLHYLSFGYISQSIIKKGLSKETMKLEDVPSLVDDDTAYTVHTKLEKILAKIDHNSSHISPNTPKTTSRLVRSLLELVLPVWLEQGFFQFLASSSLFLPPLALQQVLLYVQYQGKDEYREKGLLNIHVTHLFIVCSYASISI
jgi:hypothetical protein